MIKIYNGYKYKDYFFIFKLAPRGKKKRRKKERKFHSYDDAVYFRFNFTERLVILRRSSVETIHSK